MPIIEIEIKNYKSLKNVKLSFNKLNFLIGKNGTGKSNVLDAIQYFQDNLTDFKVDNDLYDKNNVYNISLEIAITYDITRFSKIAKKNIGLARRKSDDPHQMFLAIRRLGKKYSQNNYLTVKLKQYKNGKTRWNIKDYKTRSLIKSLFPMYSVDTRRIDLIDWEEIWDIIGDLSRKGKAYHNENEKEVTNDFADIIYEDENRKTLDYIAKELKNSDINVDKFNFQENFIHILQMKLEGKEFNFKDKNLDFFSDGINSYNYIKLLVSLVNKLSERKLKEPLIMLDEPEIGLHPNKIDKLVDFFSKKIKRTKILSATHSPRIIKNTIRYNLDYNLFHCSLNNNYTDINKMKKIAEDNQGRYEISDSEPSLYFSNAIVLLEGVTELEIFYNNKLLNLFPFLKNVDFSQHVSHEALAKLIHPDLREFDVPYLMVIDLDKIITYKQKQNKFKLTGSKLINPLLESGRVKEKEKFLYGDLGMELDYYRREINDLLEINITPNKNWNYITDKSFEELKKSIFDFCLKYNRFVLDNTIEGTLINKSNYEEVYNWLINDPNYDSEKINNIYNFNTNINYKITVLRLLFGGKYDTLKTKKQSKIENEKIKEDIASLKRDQSSKVGKNSGWVTDFLNNFLDDIQNKDEFKNYFPELYSLIKRIKKMI